VKAPSRKTFAMALRPQSIWRGDLMHGGVQESLLFAYRLPPDARTVLADLVSMRFGVGLDRPGPGRAGRWSEEGAPVVPAPPTRRYGAVEG
jgi:hypothetical protein